MESAAHSQYCVSPKTAGQNVYRIGTNLSQLNLHITLRYKLFSFAHILI